LNLNIELYLLAEIAPLEQERTALARLLKLQTYSVEL
jgi:hypothetical protein